MTTKYRHTVIRENYEDYSSGRVIYGATGATNFPVRLSSEIFQQCIHHLKSKGKPGPYKIYDPFCGVAYSLTVIGFLHRAEIESIAASDSDVRLLEFARKNLSLLTATGLDRRIQELKHFIQEYDKASHKDALESAHRLQSKLQPFETRAIQCFQFNAVSDDDFPGSLPELDVVITDLPYGNLSQWEGSGTTDNFAQRFMEKLHKKLGPISVVAVIRDKKQPISHEGYQTLRSFTLGKRKAVLLEPVPSRA